MKDNNDKPPPLCPLTPLGLSLGWESNSEFMTIYSQGPPYVVDLGSGYYRPWIDGPDSRFVLDETNP